MLCKFNTKEKLILNLEEKIFTDYLSCPFSLLIKSRVLLSQSYIFTLHLLQLEFLSRENKYYYSQVL